MKPVRFSLHALTSLADREIPRLEVEQTLAEPEAVAASHFGRQIYLRRYHDSVLDQEMLLRAVIEETETELVVVTVYKTSHIERYLRGEQP